MKANGIFCRAVYVAHEGPTNDIHGAIMRVRDEDHAREVCRQSGRSILRIERFDRAGVRGYYDHVDCGGAWKN